MRWKVYVQYTSEHCELELCECITVDALASILRSITADGVKRPFRIRVECQLDTESTPE